MAHTIWAISYGLYRQTILRILKIIYSKFLTPYDMNYHVIFLYNLYNLCISAKSKPEINDPVSQVI